MSFAAIRSARDLPHTGALDSLMQPPPMMKRFAEHPAASLGVRWIALLMTLCAVPAHATPIDDPHETGNDSPAFNITRVAGPFDHPWSIALLPDRRMLVSERWGGLKLATPGEFVAQDIGGLPLRLTESLAGLMDIVLDPDFANTGTVYLSYVHGSRDAATVRVMKAHLNLETLLLENRVILFDSNPPLSDLQEFGGRMVIDRDGHLFVSLGDRFHGEYAQDLGNDYGALIRIRTDGGIPDDNPFIETPGARAGIWSFGHRNPLGLAIDPATGRLWAHENGPKGGDELNSIEAGRNYGWPVITYGRNYDDTTIGDGITAAPDMEQPVRYWTPSIAPSGLTFYEGSVEEWQGTVWMGALAGQMLVRLKLENGEITREEQFLKDEVGRIRDVRTGSDGFIYFSTDSGTGDVYRIEPVANVAFEE